MGTKQKPTKPYVDFPLFPHASGQWAKKIRGRMFYFGVWNDAEAAAELYDKSREYIHLHGQHPPESYYQERLPLRQS